MTEPKVEFQIAFHDEDIDEVVAAAEASGAEDIEPITKRGATGIELLVIGSIAIPLFANLIFRIADRWRCGVKVDGRSGALISEKDCSLPAGSVLVVGPEGSQIHRVPDMSVPALADVLKALGR